MRNKKICMITYMRSPEHTPPLYNTMKSLLDKGYEVTGLFINESSLPRKVEIISQNFSLMTITLRSRNILNKIFQAHSNNKLLLIIRYFLTYIEYSLKAIYYSFKARADLYEAHDIQGLIPAVIVSKLLSKKFIYRAHELFAEKGEHKWLSVIQKTKEKIFIRFADLVVVPEKNRENIYNTEYKLKNRAITILNCPPYREKIQSKILYEKFQELKIEVNKIVIYQGLLAEDRCIDEIIASAEYYRDSTKLVIIGAGFGKYQDFYKKSGTFKNVLILRYVNYNDLPKYTASADIGILLYRNTGRNNYYCAPNKLFEYMMMGLPVITCNYPGLIEIVEKNEIGICVNPESPIEIAEAVNKLATDVELYKKMSNNCLQLAKTRYNWEIEFQKFYPHYINLLSN